MRYQFANGQVREFHGPKRYSTIVRPEVNRGTPPRLMTMKDYVAVPTISTHGVWNLGDMLSIDSIGNLFTAYNRAEAEQTIRNTLKRAPAKAHRA